MRKFARALTAMLMVALPACGGEDEPSDEPTAVPTMESPAATDAAVSFVSPEDGATVTSPVHVQMDAEGVAIEPAAEGVKPNSGHLHIMVDTDCLEAGQVVPADETHLHFGMAQTEADLTLPPGEHRLCLQLGDANHTATELTDEITITVEG